MAIQATLNAEKRAGIRKGANRKLRAAGRVPAILYGQDQEPITLSVDAHEAGHLFQKISVENTIIDLAVQGGDRVQALVREVQVASLRPDLIHIDFYRVQAGVTLEVEVPLHMQGVPVGVRNDGGILEVMVHELPVRCLPSQIPESIDVDVTGLELHDSLHVSDLQVPAGLEVLLEPERTICIVSAPRVSAAADEEEAEGQTPAAEG